jgi:GNAT superfamily N-acetyltransferase
MSHTGAVLAMVARCSRTTLFHRFHGFTDGVAYFAALLRDHPDHLTLLAWCRTRCIGVATLAPSAAGTADLGVMVEDHWQRRGVGTRLVSSLLPRAAQGGVRTLHADVLSDDVFLLQVLSRIGPLSVGIGAPGRRGGHRDRRRRRPAASVDDTPGPDTRQLPRRNSGDEPGGYRADPTVVIAVTRAASARHGPGGTPRRPPPAHPWRCT